MNRLLAILLMLPWAGPAVSRAGLAPVHTLVVMNEADPESVELARFYATTRGIPEANLVRVNLPVADEITLPVFTNALRNPVTQYLADTGLDPQIRQVALCWRRPFRVQLEGGNLNAICSVLFYGYRDAPPPGACELNPDAASPLFASGRAFRPADHAPRLYPAMQLTAPTLAEAKAAVARACGADFSRPAGTLHLLRTGDDLRNVQWPQFERADFTGRFLGSPVTWRVADAQTVSNEVAVAGVMAGAASHLPQVHTNAFVPGALGDHLTSFGGIPYSFAGQMPALEWLRAGCAAAYGTVAEPCNYTNKFPVADLHVWHQRGFPAGEAYAMAVSHPYQGQAYGDPLSAPFALPPAVILAGLASNAVVAGTVNVSVSAQSPVPGRRIDRLELYVDEKLHSTLFASAPAAGNTVSTSLGGTNFTHAVTAGQSLSQVAASLAAAVDASPHLKAAAGPDFVRVEQQQPGWPGAALAASASAAPGAAPALTLGAASATPAFLETRARARVMVFVQGTPTASSTIRLTLTRLDGAVVVKELTAHPGESRWDFFLRFILAVGGDPAFNNPEGVMAIYPQDLPAQGASLAHLVSPDRSWRNANLHHEWRVTGAGLVNFTNAGFVRDNADTLAGRAMVFLSAGELNPSAGVSLDTTGLADGPHTLRGIAQEGTAVATPGSAVVPFTVDNHDLDCALAWPEPGAWILQGAVVTGLVTTAGSAPVTQTRLWVEGKPLASGLAWNSSAYGPGTVPLQARVRDSLNREAWSPVVPVRVLADADRDGLADEWETLHLGGLGAMPLADADGDGRSNRDEFIAGTQPTNSLSRLRVEIERLPSGDRRLVFPASADRKYRVETSPPFPFTWSSAFPADVSGAGAPFLWTDNSPLSNRLYRVRARLP